MEREKKIEIAKMILAVIGAAGLLSVALIAPNAVQLFGIFRNKTPREARYRVNRTLKQLKDKGFLRISNGKAELTSAGEKELTFYELKQKVIQSSKKWDGKWRMVAFDIWERRRGVRDAVRNFLNQLGFVYLQNSIWVYPYECREIVELLKTRYKVRPAVLYIVAESFENDISLRKKFNLK